MLLFRFDVIEGRDEKELKVLLDVIYWVILEVFGVSECDCY